ncbi:MAG: hypothetical protein HPY76_11745 [Anaerolineae bacterium]|nr:hypothetical protein [Anaerolineae bacterium]
MTQPSNQPPSTFPPPKRRGLIFHGGAVLFLTGAGGILFVTALAQEAGNYFTLFLVLSILCFAPLPLLIYRGYALLQARYELERDGLRIRWGLRSDDIPLPEIEWVRPAAELGFHLPLPRARMPGAILGNRVVEGLGPVEFVASESDRLLLIATSRRVYAISPDNAKGFVGSFQRIFELGSVAPLEARSSRPAAYLRQVWEDRIARATILTGAALLAVLFVVVGGLIPTREAITLGFDAEGMPMASGAAQRLLLLPVLASFTYIVDLLGGLYLYRRQEQRIIAYLLWGSSAITPLLAGISVIFQVTRVLPPSPL